MLYNYVSQYYTQIQINQTNNAVFSKFVVTNSLFAVWFGAGSKWRGAMKVEKKNIIILITEWCITIWLRNMLTLCLASRHWNICITG